jgi:hypothetical protein
MPILSQQLMRGCDSQFSKMQALQMFLHLELSTYMHFFVSESTLESE